MLVCTSCVQSHSVKLDCKNCSKSSLLLRREIQYDLKFWLCLGPGQVHPHPSGLLHSEWKWIVWDYMLQPQIWSNCIIVCDWVAASCCCWSLLYSATLHSQANSLHSHVFICEWLAFHSVFLNIHQSGVLRALFDCYMAGAMWNCCHLGVFCVHHTTMHHVMSLHAKPHM